MVLVRSALGLLGLATYVAASIDGNLNYLTPSKRHVFLGIDMHKVHKRHIKRELVPADSLNFTHGVASGDPYQDSVILWTRVSPQMENDKSNDTVSGTVPLYSWDNEMFVKMSTKKICVDYAVATDKDMKNVVYNGTAHTTSDVDYTIKVEAKKLKPFTTYYYQFTVCNSDNKSPIGRTKTLPCDTKHQDIKVAVYSCNNMPQGFFNALGYPIKRDSVDYVIHLGDYIYEFPNGYYGDGRKMGRVPKPDKWTVSLYDYRTRIAQYRNDADLNMNHRMFPWIPTWDDHEVTDNTWRAGSSFMKNEEDSFIQFGNVSFDQRKANAVRAYYEWMPLRQVDMDDNLRIWRNFKIGKTLDLTMLDTRMYDRDITEMYTNVDYIETISNDQGRSMMGSRQENWFYRTLSASYKRGATWRLIGSQTIFSRLNLTTLQTSHPFSYDSWDGYKANRNRTLKHLYDNKISDNIFIAGDSHSNWVSDLAWLDEKPYNGETGAGAIGVEFAGTAVSSPGPLGTTSNITANNKACEGLVKDNVELQWAETFYRGYFELELTQKKATANFYGFKDILSRNLDATLLATFEVKKGENKLTRSPTVGGGVVKAGYLRNGKVVP